MANFVGIIDRDPARRSQFLARARDQVSVLPGLEVRTCEHGDFALAWAAASLAPVEIDRDHRGVAVLWGRPRQAGTADRVSARDCRRRAGVSDVSAQPLCDGYHAYVNYETGHGLCLGADLLGLFPIYYWENGSAMLFGSSGRLFSSHPAFSPQPSISGLIGILLTMHLVGGRTLLEGVRRLGAGSVLMRPAGGPAREIRQYQPPVSDERTDLDFPAQADLLGDTLSDAVRRQVTKGTPVLLPLSGGRDSRMIAGFLRENAFDPTAFTMGVPSDVDYRCARGVARRLQIAQDLLEIPYADYAGLARLSVEWEQMANGFNCIQQWGLIRILRLRPASEIVSGYLADPIIAHSELAWRHEPEKRTTLFDHLFTKVNAWGIHPAVVKRLLANREHRQLVDDVIQDLRTTFDAYPGSPFQRALLFDLQHRQRFHTGGNLWPFTFAGWPVVPGVDSEVFKVVARLPASSLGDRRLQDCMLIRRFPEMARLPVDRNSENVRPLAPSLAWRVRNRIGRELRRLPPFRSKANARDSLYYYRIFDFNHAGWRAIRAAADEVRGALTGLFDENVLAEVLPPASTEVHLASPIAGASSLKTLVGLALGWRFVSPPLAPGIAERNSESPAARTLP